MKELPVIMRISKTHFLVRSESRLHILYHIVQRKGKWLCNCPQGVINRECKHLARFFEWENENNTS